MATIQRNGAILAALVSFSALAGGWVGGTVGSTTSKWYVYEYISSNKVTKGFACRCQKSFGNSRKWKGSSDQGCYIQDTVADKPYSVNDPLITVHPSNIPIPPPGTPVPSDACCRSKPHASGLTSSVPEEANCI